MRHIRLGIAVNAELDTSQARGPQMVEHLRCTLPAIRRWLYLPVRRKAWAFVRHQQHSGNALIVLRWLGGRNLHTMARLVVCWTTPDSSELLWVLRMEPRRTNVHQLARLLWSLGKGRCHSTLGSPNYLGDLGIESRIFYSRRRWGPCEWLCYHCCSPCYRNEIDLLMNVLVLT